MRAEHAPVLVVGGGGAGLTASMLLARLGVDHLLVNARPRTSDLPKAHVLNQRSMEVLDDVRRRGGDRRAEHAGRADGGAPRTTRASPARTASTGRRLARLECLGRRRRRRRLARGEPVAPARTSRRSASSRCSRRAPRSSSPGRIRFGHELLELEQDDDGVRAVVRDNATGEQYLVSSRYLLARGRRSLVRGQIGVDVRGTRRSSRRSATLHVCADFSRWASDPDVLIRWIASPQAGALVVMVPMGPERWGPDSEEWVIHLNYAVDDPRAQSDAQVEADVRGALGLRTPDDDPQDHALVGRRGDGVGVPRRPRVPGRRRRAPPPADRRARADERDPRRAQPVLEARRRARRARRRRAARQLRARASQRGRAQRPALAGERRQPLRDHAAPSASRPSRRPRRTGRACAACGADGPRTPSIAAPRCARSATQSMEFGELNVEYGYAYDSVRRRPGRQPRPRSRWTTSASTSRRRDRARRCRTPGSRTRTATAARSRIWSRPGASC